MQMNAAVKKIMNAGSGDGKGGRKEKNPQAEFSVLYSQLEEKVLRLESNEK